MIAPPVRSAKFTSWIVSRAVIAGDLLERFARLLLLGAGTVATTPPKRRGWRGPGGSLRAKVFHSELAESTVHMNHGQASTGRQRPSRSRASGSRASTSIADWMSRRGTTDGSKVALAVRQGPIWASKTVTP